MKTDNCVLRFPEKKEASANLFAELKNHAEHYCNHEFNVLGSGWTKVYHGMECKGFEGKKFTKKISYEDFKKELPKFYIDEHERIIESIKEFVPDYIPIDWQADFKSGFRFSAETHHSELKYGVIEGVDAKVSADLGRLYQLATLAKAFKQSGDKKYRDECIAQLLDFIASNPAEYGGAWRANMNVSIRIANIIAALELLGLENIPDAIIPLLEKSFIEHGKYIMENLEFPESNFHPNHFIANLAGLLMVSRRIMDWHNEAEKWNSYALKTIGGEIINQSYPDGTNYENATSYHCLVLEMLTSSLAYAALKDSCSSVGEIRKWIEKNIGEKPLERLQKMFEALTCIVQPNGLIPLIGDNDSGRFLYLEGEGLDKRDWRFLSNLGAELFEDASLALPETTQKHRLYAEIFLGKTKGFKREKSERTAKAFDNAGYYIIKDDKDYLFINCSPIGTNGKGGHSHNDKLSLFLAFDNKEIFVDPGIYVYTAGRYFRNTYRSTLRHNTLSLDGKEQNRFLESSPWWGCHEDTKCECAKWDCSNDKVTFAGKHHGFERFENGAVHERNVVWEKKLKKLLVTDKLLSPKDTPESSVRFNLNRDCAITEYSEKKIKIEFSNLYLTMESENGLWTTEPYYYSPEYGMKIYGQQLVLKLEENCKSNRITIHYDY